MMPKYTCKCCGKEIGLLGSVQLADREYLCKDCTKHSSPYFIPLDCTYEEYADHQKQIEDGQKLYEAYFNKNRKVKQLAGGDIKYDPDTELLCVYGERGGLLDRKKYYCVMRAADLDYYDEDNGLSHAAKPGDGKVNFRLTFRATRGLGNFIIPMDKSKLNATIKGLDEIFNGKGLMGSFKKKAEKQKAQAMAIAGMMNGLKGAIESTASGSPDSAKLSDAANDMANGMDDLFYAGREDLIAKADAAIKQVLG